MLSRTHQIALDACILGYQTYHQSLLWPLDPWYEALARMGTDRRTNFQQKIRNVYFGAAPDSAWGSLLGPDKGDTRLDPVLTRHDQFDPKLPAFTINPGGSVAVLRAPKYLVDPIGKLSVSRYAVETKSDKVLGGRPSGAVVSEVKAFDGGTDEMIAFEGATGHSGSPETALWSLMGCVLRRQLEPNVHELYIVFRGSRSGSAERAAVEGILHHKGNADWVTDTGNSEQASFPEIAVRGKVGVGFAKACRSCFGTIEAAVAALSQGKSIKRIIVTGHSLGGGLAGHYLSAVSVGTYGQGLRRRLASLPWDSIKGIGMAMPPLGDEEFRRGFDLAQACGDFSLTNIWVDGDVIVEGVDKLGKGRLGFWSPGIRIKLPLENLNSAHSNTNPHEIIQIRASLMAQTRADETYATDYATLAQPGPKLQWGYYRHWADVLENAPSSFTSHVSIDATKLIENPAELRQMLALYRIQDSTSMYNTCLQQHFGEVRERTTKWIGYAEASLLVVLGKYLSQAVDFDDDILSPLQVMLANPEGAASVVAVLRNEVNHTMADSAVSTALTAGVVVAGAVPVLTFVAILSPLLIPAGAVMGVRALVGKVTSIGDTTEVAQRVKETKRDVKALACEFYVEVRVWLNTYASTYQGKLPEGQLAKFGGRHRSTADIQENLAKLNTALMTAQPKPRPPGVTAGFGPGEWKESVQLRMAELQTHKGQLERLALTR